MIISKILVAALVATAVAQDPGVEIKPGAKFETGGIRPAAGNPSPGDVNTFNAPMDTNFAPPAGGGGKAGGGDNLPGGGGRPGGGQPAAPAIKLAGVTGEVKIVVPGGGTMIVKAGQPVPAIPAGSQIVVVSGDATVTAGGATITANAGDSFIVNLSGSGAADIAVTGGNVTVVGSDGKSQDVAKGSGVVVAAAPVVVTPTGTPVVVVKTAVKAPDSIPSDTPADTTGTTPPASSVTQEAATSTSPSTP